MSDSAIELKYQDQIATIEFSYASCAGYTDVSNVIEFFKEKNATRYKNIYCNENGINDVRYFYDKGILPRGHGLSSLKNTLLEKLDSDTTTIKDTLLKKIESDDIINKVADVVIRERKYILIDWTKTLAPIVATLITAGSMLFLSLWLNVNPKFDELSKRIEALEPKPVNPNDPTNSQRQSGG